MRIVVCGSMEFAKEMYDVGKRLESMGHEVHLPPNTENYAKGVLPQETGNESAENKTKHDLFNHYFELIKGSDAILVLNLDKKGISNYVGGNAFIAIRA